MCLTFHYLLDLKNDIQGVFMKILKIAESNDSTKKYYFTLSNHNSAHIEACLLFLQKHGYIICISSQIGCVQCCRFCAAGSKPFIRNLTVDEILDQVALIINDNPFLLTEKFQVTYMGSGEPLSNWDHVFSSIDILRTKYANLVKVNISTIFPPSAMRRMCEIDWKQYAHFIHLQFSLHFPEDNERKCYFRAELPSISESIKAFEQISELTNDIYRINYIPFDQVNDSPDHVRKLASIVNNTKYSVLKISQMSEIQGCSLSPSKAFDHFVTSISESVTRVEVFKSDGTDINAGCGQFYNDSIL